MSQLKKRKTARIFGYVLILYYLVGLVGLSLPSWRDLFIGLMPVTLLLSAAVLLLFHQRWRSQDGIVLLFIAITGYLIEVLGVLTGHVFGSYWYGEALGVKAFGTPLIIGLNWMMLSYCVYAIMEPARIFWPLKAIAAAAMMVAYDLVMEPVAPLMDMWNWHDWTLEGLIAPIRNYQAWFIISLVFVSAMHMAKIKTQNRLAAWLFGVQLVFFIALNVTLRLF